VEWRLGGSGVNGHTRLAVAGLLGSTAVAGLLFTPVFGLAALLLPVLLVVLAGYAGAEAAARWPVLVPFRPVLVLIAGVLALIESLLLPTTVGGLPTAASLRALYHGLTEGWLLTLQSTWPARPDPEQLLFVPLTVLLAVVLGLELRLRLRTQLLALLPGLAVAGLAQAYQALTGVGAVLAALAFAIPSALLLWAGSAERSAGSQRTTGPRVPRLRLGPAAWLAVPAVVVTAASALLLIGLDPAGREPYQLKDDYTAPLRQNRLGNPLHEIAQRLATPEREVFRYASDAPVDRWSLIVLDGFDGASWSIDAQLRRLGAGGSGRPDDVIRTANLLISGLDGPWLPSQPVPLAVAGIAPLLDEATGTLVLDQPAATGQTHNYQLSWSAPQIDAARLKIAPIDPSARRGLGDLGPVPPEIEELAAEAVHGLRPTFQSALVLERFLSSKYKLASGNDLPSGHSWPQLRHFLIESKRGTSEQFAAAYVALARLSGIPARLAVGFRGSAEADRGQYVVRNRDVLAWPEVAVAGVGWVPLDPTGGAATAGPPQSGLAAAAAQARASLPKENELRQPELPPGEGEDDVPDQGGGEWVGVLLAGGTGLAGLGVCWLIGIPLAKAVRASRRRRHTGAQGVISAWAEARDRLRAYGVPYRVGMTTRDLAESAGLVGGDGTRQPIMKLAQVLDMALWSGLPATEGSVRRAWDEVRSMRKSLAAQPLTTRLRAMMEVRSLLPPPGRERGQP
jgi:transglutaminase-like putative cysteine protease